MCMCQIVNGVGNMLDLKKDMEINDQVGGGGLGSGGQLGKTHWQVEDQGPTISKDQGTRTLILPFSHSCINLTNCY